MTGQVGDRMTGRITVLRVGSALVVTLPADLTDASALALQDDLSEQVVRTGVRAVVFDLSAVMAVDSFLAGTLARIGEVCRLLSAETTVAGMRPEVAITMVELGLGLPGLRTAPTLDDALGVRSSGRSPR